MSGTLLIVGTPIGNLGDISQRTKDAIVNCDFVLAEDTRVTIKLLNHLNLKKRMLSCHEFNETKRLALIETANAEGTIVALITDAGMPLISDPGYPIVRHAIAIGMNVIPIPGPSAFVLALAGSGLPTDRFAFEGFLPDGVTAIKKHLATIASDTRTLVFYVSPHKLLKTLTSAQQELGDRKGCLARELTKKYEQFIRGTLSELIAWANGVDEIRGEFVLMIEGNSKNITETEDVTIEQIEEEIKRLAHEGMHAKEIANLLSDKFQGKKSDIYKLATQYIKK